MGAETLALASDGSKRPGVRLEGGGGVQGLVYTMLGVLACHTGDREVLGLGVLEFSV